MKIKNTLTALALAVCAGFALPAGAQDKKPNILVIFGDDIGQTNVSAYSFGVMGYKTPNIDRIARKPSRSARKTCGTLRWTHLWN